ncbi:hypothetical protein [Microbacterium gorillae]|uniref:hypothetical protein n=1 Tax=Microbacterium gorillae TaxID=1231063 RepID=UPI00058F6445|nr:hypothetical protein [Microbacterium gorillae]
MVPTDWTPHRREDGEVLGWIRPEGEDWVPVDLFGRELTAPGEWLDAESVLEEHGIGWLADRWVLERGDLPPLAVRVVEVTTERIVVKTDDFGAIDVPAEAIVLEWPVPDRLRPQSAEDRPVAPWD